MNCISLTILLEMGFSGGAKEPTCQCRRWKGSGFDPWVRKIPWRKVQQPTPIFLPEDPMDRGAWWVTVHGVVNSCTGLKRLSTPILYEVCFKLQIII